MLTAVNKAADGKDASKEIKATIDAELDADNVKAKLRSRMAEQDIRLMVSMDDFLHMLTRQDRIADYAQNVAEQLSFRELYTDKKARKMLKELAEVVSETVAVYEDTVLAMRDLSVGGETKAAKAKVAELIKQVSEISKKNNSSSIKISKNEFDCWNWYCLYSLGPHILERHSMGRI